MSSKSKRGSSSRTASKKTAKKAAVKKEVVVEDVEQPVVEETEAVTVEETQTAVEETEVQAEVSEELPVEKTPLEELEAYLVEPGIPFITDSAMLEYGQKVLELVRIALAARTQKEVEAVEEVFAKCKYSPAYVHGAIAADPKVNAKLARRVATVVSTMDIRVKAKRQKKKFDINVDNVEKELSGAVAKYLIK